MERDKIIDCLLLCTVLDWRNMLITADREIYHN